jgi:histidine triad (HIT) family protein
MLLLQELFRRHPGGGKVSLDPNCIFCRIIEKKIPSKIVYEDDLVTAFEDTNPQAPIHTLVVPKKHIPDIHSMTESDRELVGHLFFAAQKVAENRGLDAKGYRMVINNGPGAGQTVFHIHLHLLSGRRFSWPPG